MLAGAEKVIVASPSSLVAETLVGASGTLAAEIELLGSDAALVPTAFVAVTVNVYDVAFTNPVTIMGEADPDAVRPPTLELTV